MKNKTLIAAWIVAVIIVLAVILVLAQRVNPSSGAGSAITSIKKADKYHEKNTIKVELNDSLVQIAKTQKN
jgi:hypothetical protein|tara:strand:+ start:1400 stop:1612 length:213 start_codon:yes stop_codon:yes gene_type:complete